MSKKDNNQLPSVLASSVNKNYQFVDKDFQNLAMQPEIDLYVEEQSSYTGKKVPQLEKNLLAFRATEGTKLQHRIIVLMRAALTSMKQNCYQGSGQEEKEKGDFLNMAIVVLEQATCDLRTVTARLHANGLRVIEPIYKEIEIQNDHIEKSNSRSEDRRLDAVDRFKGCIFPCPGLSRTLEVPQISCGKSIVRIQSIALRDNISSEGVYKDDGSGDREYQKNDRTLQLCVPRRLLGEGQGQVVFGIKISNDDRIHDQDRFNYKLGEVRTRANTRPNVHRGQIFDQNRHRDDSGRSSRGNHDNSGENKESKKGGCQTVSEVPRTTEQLHISGRMGKTIHQTITAVSSSMVEAQQSQYRRHDSDFTISDGTHSLVGAGEQFAEGSVVRSTGSATDLCIGCEQDRLGSLSRVRRRSQREMVRRQGGETYQLAGDEGNFQCIDIFPGHGEGTSDQGDMR